MKVPQNSPKATILGCCIGTKTFEIYNLATANATLMKHTTIMYLHDFIWYKIGA